MVMGRLEMAFALIALLVLDIRERWSIPSR